MSVLFRDATEIVRTYLVGRFPTLTIVSEIPAARPDEFVLIRRVGGVARNLVTDEATLAVEGWAATKPAAHDLLQTVRAAITELPQEGSTATPVYRVTEFAGPASLPDPDSKHDRFTYTVSVAIRGADSATLTT